jgi:PAS domain S-box-containing protein
MRIGRWRDTGVDVFRSALIFVICLCIDLPAETARAVGTGPTQQQIEVLVLSSSDPDSPDVATMIERAQNQILDGSDTPVHFSLEYLKLSSSLASLPGKRATESYLREKYRGQAFNLVIVIGEETLSFAEQIRSGLFPVTPLLFFMVNPQNNSGQLNQKAGRTGVVRKLNYVPTLQLALRQNPGTYHVVVVAGSSDVEKLEVKVAREQFASFESNLEFQYLTGLQLEELAPRLAQVPSDSIILLLDFETDPGGEMFIPSRILPTVAKTANRPIYGTFTSFVGNGAVGGSVADLGEVGRVLGRDGARILKGEKPENIPISTGDFQHYVIDWRQLHRWGIAENEIPPESVVLYWKYSAWELYRWRVLGLCILLLVEMLLIVLLLRNIAKRKRAQAELSRKEMELAEGQRLAQVGNWLWDPKNDAFTWSEELYRIHGLDPRLPVPSFKELPRLFTPESWGQLSSAIDEGLRTGSVPELDVELVRPDGSTRWITARGLAVRDAVGRPIHLRGTAQDITDRKRAEQAVLESEKRFRLVANTAPVMIWMSGLDKLRDYFNLPWLEFTGRPLVEELGNGWADGVHPEDLRAFLDTYTRAFDARQSFKMQYRLRRHDGEYRWFFDTGVPRLDGNDSFAGYIGSCIDITDRKLAEETLSTVGRRLIEAQEEERSRIARELHDDINQRLALLANRVQECEQATSAVDDPLLNKELREIWRLTNEIATDIQHMSHQLHPSKLHYLGMAAAVRDLCHEFSRQHKLDVDCLVRDVPQDLEENVSLSLFRTVQESLRNVVKHSHAHHVKVELTRQSNAITLSVSDDGIGFNPESARSSHGLGLVSMQERLRSVGGEFSIWSRPSQGTKVKANVPATTKAVRRAEDSFTDLVEGSPVSFDSSPDH